MSGWQPIETAPKDGTWVLLYEHSSYSAYRPHVSVAKWHSWDGYGEACVGWYVSDENCHEFTVVVDEPTHWMQIPPPPEAA